MTTNYNTIHIPNPTFKWEAGMVFSILPEHRKFHNWRVLCFDGLIVESVGYQFGTWLHFDWFEWKAGERKYFEAARKSIKKTNNGNKFPNF